jgi:DNA-directed RNA polymerase subunit M/transcription elongation factor TFIIS
MTLQYNALTSSEKAQFVQTAMIGQRLVGHPGQRQLRPLAHTGWVNLVRTTKTGEVYEVTPEARTALLALPDNSPLDGFPWPSDIAHMKEMLSAEQAGDKVCPFCQARAVVYLGQHAKWTPGKVATYRCAACGNQWQLDQNDIMREKVP